MGRMHSLRLIPLLFASLSVLVGTVSFTACSADAIDPDNDAATNNGIDAGADVAEDLYPCSAIEIEAKKLDVAIDPPRDHHVSFIHETKGTAYVYVAGGARDEFSTLYDDVQRAKIQEDGTLAPFEPAGKLPRRMAGMAIANVGEHVFLFSGLQNSALNTNVYGTTFDENGMLGSWKEAGLLPKGVMHAASVVRGNDVYIFGGVSRTTVSDSVSRYTVGNDGVLSERVDLALLTSPRSHESAWTFGKHVFLSGGFDKLSSENPPALTDVSSTTFDSSGGIASWSSLSPLKNPNSVHPSTVVGCHAITAGGYPGGNSFSNGIYSLKLGEDGTIVERVDFTAKLSVARGHMHQLPRHGKYLYAIAGRISKGLASTGGIDLLTITNAER